MSGRGRRSEPPLDRFSPPGHNGRAPEARVRGDIGSMSFEDALARLESIVKRLERGDAPLEDSIALYEEGVKLKQHCEGKLETASARIQKIQPGPDGQPAGLAPFDAA